MHARTSPAPTHGSIPVPLGRAEEIPATAPAVADAVDVILRDGGTLRLRSPAAEDGPDVLRFFDELSEQSRYLRFHGFVHPDTRLVAPVPRPRLGRTGALVGGLVDDGHDRIVALATYTRLRDVETAEVALAVADDQHGRGIGTRLLEQLAERARRDRDHDLRRRACCRKTRPRWRSSPRRASSSSAARATARSSCVSRSLRRPATRPASRRATTPRSPPRCGPFFEPAIGRGRRRVPPARTIGGELFRNILTADFAGAVYPVNLRAGARRRCPRLAVARGDPRRDRPRRVCVPAGRCSTRRSAALRRGVRALCVISAGFAERRREGAQRQDAAARRRARSRRAARRPELPRHRRAGAGLNATFAPRALPPGRSASRRRAARSGWRCSRRPRARARLLVLHVDRQQGRCFLQRFARVVGGRPRHRRRAALSGVVRQPAQVRARRPPRRPAQADPRPEGRLVGRRRPRRGLAHRRARGLRRGRRRALPAGRRAPCPHARGAHRHGRRSLQRRCRTAGRSR